MTNKMLLNALRVTQIVVFLLIPTIMFAPPIPPPPGGSTPITPIDGGLVFLLIAGVTLGVITLIKSRKKISI